MNMSNKLIDIVKEAGELDKDTKHLMKMSY